MTHRRANDILTVFVVLFALYILLAPLLPNIRYWWNGHKSPNTPTYVVTAAAGHAVPLTVPIPTENRISIPAIRADAQIYQGPTDAVLLKGPWLRPKTPAPGMGGNTVIAGHRFSYNPTVEQPFYHLDKLNIGDKIVIAWEGKVFTYSVTQKKVVKATETSIEGPTKQPQLTLYTCTPLWDPVNRLVIVATQEGSN